MQKQFYLINHVMSKDIESEIFSAILQYFKKYSPAWLVYVVSIEPVEGADVYHYHRPHLETKLAQPSVCTVHHDLDDPDIWHARQRFLPRYVESAAVVCLNKTQREILIDEGISADKLYVAPHGYNDKMLYLKSGDRPDVSKVTIGIASRRYGRRVKGEAYLHELVKRLDPDVFRFILVGQDRGIDAADFRQLGFEVKVFERLPYRVFQSFYEEIDVLLMCSSHEGGPANIPEALSTGTPLFSSAVGMAKDFVRHEQNGIVLTMDAEMDAIEIIKVCVTDTALLRQLCATCASEATTIPTWKKSVEDNVSAYSKIIGVDLFLAPEQVCEMKNEPIENNHFMAVA